MFAGYSESAVIDANDAAVVGLDDAAIVWSQHGRLARLAESDAEHSEDAAYRWQFSNKCKSINFYFFFVKNKPFKFASGEGKLF